MIFSGCAEDVLKSLPKQDPVVVDSKDNFFVALVTRKHVLPRFYFNFFFFFLFFSVFFFSGSFRSTTLPLLLCLMQKRKSTLACWTCWI